MAKLVADGLVNGVIDANGDERVLASELHEFLLNQIPKSAGDLSPHLSGPPGLNVLVASATARVAELRRVELERALLALRQVFLKRVDVPDGSPELASALWIAAASSDGTYSAAAQVRLALADNGAEATSEKAEAALDRVLGSGALAQEDRLRARFRRAQLRRRRGALAEAANDYAAARESANPEIAVRSLLALGRIRDILGEGATAMGLYREVIDREHAIFSPKAAYWMGDAFVRQDRLKAAVGFFQIALDSGDPESVCRAGLRLGAIHGRRRAFAEAADADRRAATTGYPNLSEKAATELKTLNRSRRYRPFTTR